MLLHAINRGDVDSGALLPLIYDELRALAGAFFRDHAPGHTLQPTAIVHEAYMKLVNARDPGWQSKRHFIDVAAKAMRQVLLNHARAGGALKRGGGRARLTLSTAIADGDEHVIDVIELEDALARLEHLDPRQCRVVELRFFGGLSVEETARLLDVAPRTVKTDWAMARAWLFNELHGTAAS